MKAKVDPCSRAFFGNSLTEEMRVTLWLPKRDKVDMLPSALFGKFHTKEHAVFMMGMLVRHNLISAHSFGVN